MLMFLNFLLQNFPEFLKRREYNRKKINIILFYFFFCRFVKKLYLVDHYLIFSVRIIF